MQWEDDIRFFLHFCALKTIAMDLIHPNETILKTNFSCELHRKRAENANASDDGNASGCWVRKREKTEKKYRTHTRTIVTKQRTLQSTILIHVRCTCYTATSISRLNTIYCMCKQNMYECMYNIALAVFFSFFRFRRSFSSILICIDDHPMSTWEHFICTSILSCNAQADTIEHSIILDWIHITYSTKHRKVCCYCSCAHLISLMATATATALPQRTSRMKENSMQTRKLPARKIRTIEEVK